MLVLVRHKTCESEGIRLFRRVQHLKESASNGYESPKNKKGPKINKKVCMCMCVCVCVCEGERESLCGSSICVAPAVHVTGKIGKAFNVMQYLSSHPIKIRP